MTCFLKQMITVHRVLELLASNAMFPDGQHTKKEKKKTPYMIGPLKRVASERMGTEKKKKQVWYYQKSDHEENYAITRTSSLLNVITFLEIVPSLSSLPRENPCQRCFLGVCPSSSLRWPCCWCSGSEDFGFDPWNLETEW